MTNIFKKSLLAIALASVSTGAMAATIDDGTGAYPAPGAAISPTLVDSAWLAFVSDGTAASPANRIELPEMVLTLGANYADNDLITLTFTGAIDTSSLPDVVDIDDGAGGAKVGTLGLISTTSEGGVVKANYRATNVTANTTGKVAKLSVLGKKITIAPSKVGTGVSVSFSAETNNGLPLDTAGGKSRTAQLVGVGTVLSSVRSADPVTAGPDLSGVIDVSESRLEFESIAGVPDTPTYRVYADNIGAAGNPFSAFAATTPGNLSNFEYEYTLEGDFGWMLKADGTVDTKIAEFDAGANCGNKTAVVTADKIVATCPTLDGFAPVFTIKGTNTRAIPVQDFGLSVKVSFDVTDATTASKKGTKTLSTPAGKWTLNGSIVKVAYMPYRSDITQIINVTNRSGQTGDVSVTAIAEDGSRYDLGVVAESEKYTVNTIAGGIKNALEAKLGPITSMQRFAFEIVTNAPDNAVEVYSAYNVGGTGARLVVNDSNGK